MSGLGAGEYITNLQPRSPSYPIFVAGFLFLELFSRVPARLVDPLVAEYIKKMGLYRRGGRKGKK